jgi:hypothetical protein
MKSILRIDIDIEDHEHTYELADISIMFQKNKEETCEFIWAVCTNCHEFKQNVSSEEVESWYDNDN